jgi:polysaccharide export outer membrane protein
MKHNNIKPGFWFKLIKAFFSFTLLALFISSCVTQRDLEYIKDKNKSIKSFNEAQVDDYRLKASDELYIQISSLDDAAANIFSGSVGQQIISAGTITPYGASLLSYTIDKDGYLHLPVIGSLLVKDKTVAQVSLMLKESLINILSQPIVSVKLVNRYISVIGEVRNPGHYAYAQDKLTIYDALGFAGDITDFGNRKEVILTRNENGKNIRINVNLTQSDILSSNYYYMRPNDIIYVKPLRKRFWDLAQFPYTVILSALTTALLVWNIASQ